VRIKIDENLPASLSKTLSGLGHDVETVPDEGLRGGTDPEVWEAAQREARFLITQDLDFSDVRHLEPGTHHGLLLVRLRDPARRSLIARVEALFRAGDVEGWARCFVVATDHRLRVRRPKP
jgi:predicted nuclease of predicted toxin-antitoxin system